MSVGKFSEARATESNVNVEQTLSTIERMNLNFLLFFMIMNIGFLCTNTNIRELWSWTYTRYNVCDCEAGLEKVTQNVM